MMRTTIDKVGRVVLPKTLRDAVGIRAGAIEVTIHGGGLLLQPVAGDQLQQVHGLLLLSPGDPMTVDDVNQLRDHA